MVLVDKENVKGYVQMDEKEHTKKEYASKGLAGTALGLGIGGLAVSLLNNGCNPLGIFGRNCGTNAGEVAIAANEQYLERKQCADFVELVNGMWQKAYDAQKARQDDRNVLNAELFSIYSAMRNGFDAINAKHNEDAFNLYKYSRDSKDELSSEVEKQDNKTFLKSIRKLHESIKGAHFDEEYAKWQVSTMHHTADNGKVCKGEIYNYDCAKNVFDKYVRNINSSITVWDVYVAINAQYHDYVRLYSEWFHNINKNELDNKIIESAITFYFKDEDSGSTKTWNYFKTAN